MDGTCAPECGCCQDGQCRAKLYCSYGLQMLVLLATVFGCIALSLGVYCLIVKYCAHRRRRVQAERADGSRSAPRGRNRRFENNAPTEISLQQAVQPQKRKNVNGTPDNEIPFSVPMTSLPQHMYFIDIEDTIVPVGVELPPLKELSRKKSSVHTPYPRSDLLRNPNQKQGKDFGKKLEYNLKEPNALNDISSLSLISQSEERILRAPPKLKIDLRGRGNPR